MRFQEAATKGDRLRTDIALAEALQWSSLAFTSHSWEHPLHESKYVRGLLHAWNVVKHTGAEAWSYATQGVALPLQFAMAFSEARWRQFADLPRLSRQHEHAKAREEGYRGVLEGQPCRFALNVATAILIQARTGRVDPDEIAAAAGEIDPKYQ